MASIYLLIVQSFLYNFIIHLQVVIFFSDNIPYKVVLSLGRNSGTGELKNGIIVPEFVIRKLKSRDIMIRLPWDTLKQKMPK